MASASVLTREVHMEKGPIARTLLIFTTPVLLSQLLQQFYNITDCMIVGRFCGDYGLAATGIGGLILSVMINFFIGFSTGVGVIVSQRFGAYDYRSLKQVIATMIHLGMIVGAAFTVGCMLFATGMLAMLNCPGQVLPSASMYLMICSVGIVPSLVYNIANAILRALGDTRSSLQYLLCSSGLNLILDVILCVVFPFGLKGAAIATVISQWFLLCLILIRLYRMSPAYAYRPGTKPMPLKDLGNLVGISLPSGMQAIFMSISSLVLQVSINQFGPAAIAGITVFAKVEGFLYYPAFSYGIALTGFVGQNYGARCMERVRESVRLSLKLSVAIMVPLSLLLMALASPILQWFTTDAATIANGLQAIYSIFPLYVLYTINQVYLGALKGLGKTTFPMICTLLCYCMFRVLWCQVLIPLFPSMMVVYTSYDVSWFLMIAMLVPMLRKTLKEKEEYCLLHSGAYK